MLGSELSEADNYSWFFVISPATYQILLPPGGIQDQNLWLQLQNVGRNKNKGNYLFRFMYHTGIEITDKGDIHFPSIVEQSSWHLVAKYQAPQKI